MKILIVDDNDDNLTILETLLRGSGYEVVSAGNGVEALEKLRKDSIDMIVSDILMPVMDGFQFCRVCKKDNSLIRIPFVFYTATYTDKKDEEFALSLGAEKFVIKPLEPDAFLDTLKTVIEDQRNALPVTPETSIKDEEVFLAEYNKRLVMKLEKKVLDLEKEMDVRKRAEDKVKASLRERELLIAEIYHRTRNNMSVICSLLRMKSESNKDEKVLTILREVDNMIRSMSLVHAKLYQSKDLSNINLNSYIKDLAHGLFKSYLVSPDTISLKLNTN